jgi:hypothetical protein
VGDLSVGHSGAPYHCFRHELSHLDRYNLQRCTYILLRALDSHSPGEISYYLLWGVHRSKVGLRLDLVATKWLSGSDNSCVVVPLLLKPPVAEMQFQVIITLFVVSIPKACTVRQLDLSLLFTPGGYSRRCTRVCLYCSVGLSESSRPPNFST